MCRILSGHPWNKTREEILALDPGWIGQVLFCERDEQGRAKLDGEGGSAPLDFRQQLLTVARLRGWDEETASKWADEQIERQAAYRPQGE